MYIKPVNNENLVAVEKSNELANESGVHKVTDAVAIDADEMFIKLDNGISFLLDWTRGIMWPGIELHLEAKIDENSHPYFQVTSTDVPRMSFKLYKYPDMDFYKIIG